MVASTCIQSAVCNVQAPSADYQAALRMREQSGQREREQAAQQARQATTASTSGHSAAGVCQSQQNSHQSHRPHERSTSYSGPYPGSLPAQRAASSGTSSEPGGGTVYRGRGLTIRLPPRPPSQGIHFPFFPTPVFHHHLLVS